MTQTSTAPRPATVRIVREGMGMTRWSIATGALLGMLTYSEWDGCYTVTRTGWTRTVRTQDRGRALHALALCSA
jgi:hypothetical protein